jgi:hypothetical protein
MKLVRDNSAQNVEDVTASTFEEYAVERDVLKAVKTLAQLRGIGPATASLLLSVLDLDEVPFFSDEVFRWVNWDEADSAKGGGWDRVIKYTAKEYKEVVERVGDVRERLGVRAVDVEMLVGRERKRKRSWRMRERRRRRRARREARKWRRERVRRSEMEKV